MKENLTKTLERRLLCTSRPIKLTRRKVVPRVVRADDKPEEKPEEGKEGEASAKEEEDEEEEPGTLDGYAAVFYNESDPGTEYELYSGYGLRIVERISPGAFARAIREKDDCRGLFNHDCNHVLGRTAAGTLRLSEDTVGLLYSMDLPDTTMGRDVAEMVDRGDVSGSSFGFMVEQQSWREIEGPDETLAIRMVESVRLFDVGPVVYPAYVSSSANVSRDESQDGKEVRSREGAEEAKASYDRWKESRKKAPATESVIPLEATLAMARARAVEVGLN